MSLLGKPPCCKPSTARHPPPGFITVFSLLLKDLFHFYLQGRVTKRKGIRDTERSFIPLFSPQMATNAGADPARSQEPGIPLALRYGLQGPEGLSPPPLLPQAITGELDQRSSQDSKRYPYGKLLYRQV